MIADHFYPSALPPAPMPSRWIAVLVIRAVAVHVSGGADCQSLCMPGLVPSASESYSCSLAYLIGCRQLLCVFSLPFFRLYDNPNRSQPPKFAQQAESKGLMQHLSCICSSKHRDNPMTHIFVRPTPRYCQPRARCLLVAFWSMPYAMHPEDAVRVRRTSRSPDLGTFALCSAAVLGLQSPGCTAL